jgi:hypothetical protein
VISYDRSTDKPLPSLFTPPAGRVAKCVVLAVWVPVAALVAPSAGKVDAILLAMDTT